MTAAAKTLEERMHDLEEVVRERAKPTQRMTIVCPTCNAEDTLDVDELVEQTPALVTAQLARLIRTEIRHASNVPATEARPLPPFDLDAERSACASAVLGLSWKSKERLTGRQFFSPLYGAIWDLCRRMPGGRVNRVTVAAQLNADQICERSIALMVLEDLASPHTAASCSRATCDRILEVAWQRTLYYQASDLTALLRDAGRVERGTVRGMLMDLLAELESGPEGDQVMQEIERAAVKINADMSPAAVKMRAKKYVAQRDLIYQASAVVGWLRRDTTPAALESAKTKLGKLVDQVHRVHHDLYALYEQLDGSAV